MGGGQKGVNRGGGAALESTRGALNAARTAARQRGDNGTAKFARQYPHRLKIALRRDGKSCLDDVYAQAIQLVGHAHLLGHVHAATRRLFSVAQGRIEYGDVLWLSQVFLPGRKGRA